MNYEIGDRVTYKLSDSINWRTGKIIDTTPESYIVLNDRTDYSDRLPRDWKSLSKINEDKVNKEEYSVDCPF